MPTREELVMIRQLLKEGDPQKADDVLAAIINHERSMTDSAPAKPVEPPPPRSAYAITLDLFTEIVAHLGNKPSLEQLLEELRAAKD